MAEHADQEFLSGLVEAVPAADLKGPPEPLDFNECLNNKGPVNLREGDQQRQLPGVAMVTGSEEISQEVAQQILSCTLGCNPDEHDLDFLLGRAVDELGRVQTLAVSTRLLRNGELWYKNYTAILYVAAQLITKKTLWDGIQGRPSYFNRLIALVESEGGDLGDEGEVAKIKAVLPFAFRAVYNALVLRFNSTGAMKHSITS